MPVVLAAPTAPPGVVGPEWVGVAPRWTGWDGSVWPLSEFESGVFLMEGGVRGLSMPPVKRWTSSSPAVAGSRWRGSVAEEREVFWPLFVYSDAGSAAWVERDRAFWRTMHPDKPGSWSVSLPDGSTRSLSLRFVDDGDATFERCPVFDGWAKYGITLVAEQPYWQGRLESRTWKVEAAPPSFFGAGAPSFNIGSASDLAGAALDNPGDVDTWVKWVITGPTTTVTVGVEGRTIEVPFALATGETLTIDSAPTAQTATMQDGTDRTGSLGAVDFAPLPPGDAVPLTLTMAGSGQITATYQPQYLRAW